MKDTGDFRTSLENAKRSSVGQLLIRAARLFNDAGLKRIQADPRYAGARAAHLAVLPHLDLEGTRLVEIARRMGISKQAVSQLIDDLEAYGIVERRADPEDRRAKRVIFTDRGRASLFDGLATLRAIEEEVLTGLTDTRRQRLREDLVRIATALERQLTAPPETTAPREPTLRAVAPARRSASKTPVAPKE